MLRDEDSLSVSVITVLEFNSFSGLTEQDLQLFRSLMRSVRVFDLSHTDEELIDAVVQIRREKRIKLPDALIAATAMRNRLTLLTADAQLHQLGDMVEVRAF